MKTKQFLFMMFVLPLLLGTTACDKQEKENEVPKELIGSWKLKGFGNDSDNSFREAEPKDCKNCFVIQFFKDNTGEGRSIFNELLFDYKCKGSEISLPRGVAMTKIYEDGGDGTFWLYNEKRG